MTGAGRGGAGARDGGVLEAIAARARRVASGEAREDGRRLGIVAEGGAMRAIVSGGFVVGLEDLGLTEVFDVAHGSSAGAVNLAYFLSGRAERASAIYTEHAASRAFVNPLRVGRMLDVDFLFDKVMRERFPFDLERLRGGPTELKASVTDARTGRNRMLSLRDPSLDPYEILKASSAVPFYAGRRVRLDDREYVDGLASEALPVRAALDEGCTHLLVVLSAPPDQGSGRPPRPGRHDIAWPERLLLRRHHVGFRRAYLTRRRRVRRALDLARQDERVLLVPPGPGHPVPSRVSRDRQALQEAFDAARRHAHELFEPWGLRP